MIDALPLLLGPEGYQISRSVRLRASASAYLNRTFGTPTDAKKWTFNRWVKRGSLGARQSLFSAGSSGTSYAHIEFKSDDTIQILSENSAVQFQLVTTQVFRDPSAWYNLHIIYDCANATSSDRLQIWINGVRVTAFSTATYPSTTPNNLFNTAIAHYIGVYSNGFIAYFDGYQTELNFIDGQALTPSSFGETNPVTGVWQPKKYTGTYGANGFYLNFSDNSAATAAAIGKDYSGNGNNWTPNNISVTAGSTYDSMLDVPTQWADGGNGRGNYAVMNPLDGVLPTLTNGNLQVSIGAGTTSIDCGTMAVTSGKWYWEVSPSTISNNAMRIGVSNYDLPLSSRTASAAGGWVYVSNGNKANNGTSVAYGSAYTTSNIIGVALDMDTGTLEFFEDGVSQGVAYSTGLAGKLIGPSIGSGTGVGAQAAAFNFGQRPFAYTPPTGFKALNTLNLPAPTILKGNQYMNVVTYTATPGTGNTISGVGFQTDLLWTKNRDNVEQHYWQDSVRGFSPSAGVTQMLSSNSTAAETSVAGITCTTTSDGFTVVDSAPASGEFWFTNRTYVAWLWKEGATQGFDIVTYTGDGTSPRNISHSLGVAPSMVIVKNRSATASWMVKHKNLSSNNNVFLESTGAQTTPGNGYIQDLNNSSTFGVINGGGGVANINANGNNYVAYLFSEVAGFSKFGSYTGNGSADGPFVFCGFRPRWILVKRTDSTGNWFIWDTARDPYNTILRELYPDSSSAEVTRTGSSDSLDALSNGFKMRFSSTYADRNASGGTYIYAAFAEVPYKFALGR